MDAQQKARAYFKQLSVAVTRSTIYGEMSEFFEGDSFLLNPEGDVFVDGRCLSVEELREFVAWRASRK